MSDSMLIRPSEQQRPTRLQVRMTLAEPPPASKFTRHLVFERQDAASNPERKSIALPLRKAEDLVWTFDTAAGYLSSEDSIRKAAGVALHELGTLVDIGNRGYWDRMFIANQGGGHALKIARLAIHVSYGGSTYENPPEVVDKTYPLIDAPVQLTLDAGDHEINLDALARSTRWSFAGVTHGHPSVVRMAAADLGTSGSDHSDRFGANPKYGPRIDNLCSEFVSWYYAEAGIKIAGKSVRDVTSTQTLYDLFLQDKRLYEYDSATRMLRRPGGVAKVGYLPRPGDFLARRTNDSSKSWHSMMILRWLPGDGRAANAADQHDRAVVINGPWPVGLRVVRVGQLEDAGSFEFWVGSIA